MGRIRDWFAPRRYCAECVDKIQHASRSLNDQGERLDVILATLKERKAEQEVIQANWQETLDAVIETAIDRWNAIPEDAPTLPVWLGLTEEEYEAWRTRRWDELVLLRGSREREDPGA